MLTKTNYEISDNIKMYLIDIVDISSELTRLLDSFFVKIREGNSGTELSLVKQDFKDFLDKKKGSELEKGIISELFIHLMLNDLGYKQECLYENLEENSIKKGFDGYYSLNKEEWIMESKSGTISSKDITHEGKIKEGYDALKGMLGKKQDNNPWKNAYHHAQLRDVNTEKSIIKNIKKFSDDYRKGIFYEIGNFNIIPASTIFLEGNWVDTNKDELKTKILEKIATFSYKKIIVLCVTKKSIDSISKYLDN